MKQFNRTYAEVNLDAIRHNIDEVHKNIKEGSGRCLRSCHDRGSHRTSKSRN